MKENMKTIIQIEDYSQMKNMYTDSWDNVLQNE